jgi:hypothetical protein
MPLFKDVERFPDEAFIPYDIGLMPLVMLWREWRQKRRERPRLRDRLLRRQRPPAGGR